MANVQFSDNFDNGFSNQWGFQRGKPSQIQIVDAPGRSGKAVKFSVNRNDPDAAGSKRAEIKLTPDPRNQDRWYSFDLMLPPDWQNDKDYTTVAQWHEKPDFDKGENWRTPPLALRTINGNWSVINRWSPKPVNTGKEAIQKEINLGSFSKGVWTSWLFHVKWSHESDGILEVWKDGKLVIDQQGSNTYNDESGNYFKTGIYKSGFKKPGKSNVDSVSVYLDNFRVSDVASTSPGPRPKPDPNPSPIPGGETGLEEIRINAGGEQVTDSQGRVWKADTFFTGTSEAHSTTKAIAGTTEDKLYQTERWGQDLSYAIPIKNGTYDVKLHHAEIFFGKGPGQRVFDTKVEGKLVADDLDLGKTGSHTAYVQTIKGVEVKDGKLNIDLSATANNAQLAGIEVVKAGSSPMPQPSPTPKPTPGFPSPIVVEAESMKANTYRVRSNPFASGKSTLSLKGGEKGETGMASFDFAGRSGKYDVVVGYFDENDGVGQMKVQHEQTVLDTWNLEQQLGSGAPDAKSLTSRMVARGLFIEQGDTFTLTGKEADGEFARIDSVQFVPAA
jgi:hypothetical protein